jgi:hypothetical protein
MEELTEAVVRGRPITRSALNAHGRHLERQIRGQRFGRPFKWTKSADQIMASVKRFCHKAQQTLCGEL